MDPTAPALSTGDILEIAEPSNHILVCPEDAGYSTNVSTYYDQLNVGFTKKENHLMENDYGGKQYFSDNANTPTYTPTPSHGHSGNTIWGVSVNGDPNYGFEGTGDDSEVTNKDTQRQELIHIYNQNSGGPTFETKLQTKSNGKEVKRMFFTTEQPWIRGRVGVVRPGEVIEEIDIPDLDPTPVSSWLRNVTGLWFLFDGKGTTETRDCYVRVDKAAIQYFKKAHSQKQNILFMEEFLTEKLGNISYGAGIRGNDTRVFGYQLPREKREKCKQEGWQFYGIRFQLSLKRGANGTTTDTLKSHVHAMRLSLGDASLGSINQNTRMAIVGDSKTPWVDWDSQSFDKFKLEIGRYRP